MKTLAGILCLLMAGGIAWGAGDPTQPDLIYDPATGNVTLDLAELSGGQINNFVLEDLGGGFITGVANFPSMLSATDTTTEISWTDILNPITSPVGGQWDLGPILSDGMTASEVDALLDTATYTTPTFASGSFEVVPEPTTIGIIVVGGMGILLRRRS